MNEKRKISTRKIVQTLVTLVLLCCCVFVMLSASKIQETKNLKGVYIAIKNEEYCQFVNKAQIRKAVFENRHLEPNKMTIGKVDLNKMEAILATNPWIENAQVFVDNKKDLNINVTQRIPQLRVFDRIGNTYYLDSSMQVLPISEHYNHYEVLFVNVPVIKDDSLGSVLKRRMLSIAKYIKRDTFWLAQTSQIIVNDVNDFQLVPVLGKQRILLGNACNLGEKLQNVFAFYQKVMSKIGWDWYETLDARFKNQIVASPSLPWKAPVDRALTNMNWVKTIVGDVAKTDNASNAIVQKINPTSSSKDSLKPR
jgi:cell division protein FtsQ